MGLVNGMLAQTDSKGDLLIEGNAFEEIHSDGKTGVSLKGRIRVLVDNGSILHDKDKLKVEAADSAVVLIALRTNFECEDPFEDCFSKVEAATKVSYEELKAEHIKEHTSLMDLMFIKLGDFHNEAIPTDLRIDRVKSGEVDPGLDALLFNYGRYLVVGSSRENSPLPSHLQGIWNDNLACKMDMDL